MNTARKTIYAVVVIAVVAPLVYLWIVRRGEAPSVPPATPSYAGTATYPVGAPESVPAAGETIVLGTPQGSVTTKNFYRNKVDADGGFVTIARTDDREISYEKETSTFFVSLPAGAGLEKRKEAEQALIDALGIGKDDACKLSVAVVMYERNANGQVSGGSSRLSFCTN